MSNVSWLQGHAFEARVYSENPARGFMPSPGTIASWRVPPGSVAFTHAGDVRVDSGVQQGDQVILPQYLGQHAGHEGSPQKHSNFCKSLLSLMWDLGISAI